MFSIERMLFDGQKRKLRATDYEWPFAFVFGDHFVLRANPFDTKNNSLNTWASSDGNHPIPPTLLTYSSSNTEAAVLYTIKAKVPRDWADWTSKTYLNFQPEAWNWLLMLA